MTDTTTAAIRAWARANGIDVGKRGRIKAAVLAAYAAEQAGHGES